MQRLLHVVAGHVLGEGRGEDITGRFEPAFAAVEVAGHVTVGEDHRHHADRQKDRDGHKHGDALADAAATHSCFRWLYWSVESCDVMAMALTMNG